MSSSSDREEAEKQAIRLCTNLQIMIDFTAKHLNGLRSECATTEEITQKEIREAESKLVKLFSSQLVAKRKLQDQDQEMPECLGAYPQLPQWLYVVGLPDNASHGLIDDELTFDGLMGMSESDISQLLKQHSVSDRDIHTLNTALENLKECTEKQLKGEIVSRCDWHFTNLFLSAKSGSGSPNTGLISARDNSPKSRPHLPSTPTADLSSLTNTYSGTLTTERGGSSSSTASMSYPYSGATSHSTPSSPIPSTHMPPAHRYTPPSTPPSNRQKAANAGKYPSTPPPIQKLLLFPDAQPIQKSKSHESQLANRVVDIDPIKTKKKPQNIKLSSSHEALFFRRLSAEGDMTSARERGLSGHSSPISASPVRSPPCKQDLEDRYANTLMVPRSPKTPSIGPKLHHQIMHRFTSNFVLAPCDYCTNFVIRGKACRFCKSYAKQHSDPVRKQLNKSRPLRFLRHISKKMKTGKKYHKDCASKAPATCGLSDAHVDAIIDWSGTSDSPVPDRRRTNPNLAGQYGNDDWALKPNNSMPNFPGGYHGGLHDSGSNTSSCNSSTPSSPALHNHMTSSGTGTSPSPAPASPRTQFQFPEVHDRASSLPGTMMGYNHHDCSDFDDVVSTSTSNDSDKTLIESNASDRLDRVDSVDSQDDPLGHSVYRQNSLAATMKEWNIPYEELVIGEQIGKGRFGTVNKGHWHGDVAIKILDFGNESDNQFAAFRQELAVLHKTRHENLVLFMGACMKPPRLAIVTSFCKGETLYTLIHIKKDTFKINKAMIIASQVAQGMSYLHHKGIVHKDLRSKNIFIDSGKVVITDFGLFHVTKICRGSRKDDWLSVPRGWLCYLAPEIICKLKARQHANMDLPFTQLSDVYAFGTVWYELLVNEWPFRSQPCETVIWQVGRGMKQSLSSVTAPREVKDILLACWSFKQEDRPDFVSISKALERVPRTRLIRSPSHPVHLSRSTDAIFQA